MDLIFLPDTNVFKLYLLSNRVRLRAIREGQSPIRPGEIVIREGHLPIRPGQSPIREGCGVIREPGKSIRLAPPPIRPPQNPIRFTKNFNPTGSPGYPTGVKLNPVGKKYLSDRVAGLSGWENYRSLKATAIHCGTNFIWCEFEYSPLNNPGYLLYAPD